MVPLKKGVVHGIVIYAVVYMVGMIVGIMQSLSPELYDDFTINIHHKSYYMLLIYIILFTTSNII